MAAAQIRISGYWGKKAVSEDVKTRKQRQDHDRSAIAKVEWRTFSPLGSGALCQLACQASGQSLLSENIFLFENPHYCRK